MSNDQIAHHLTMNSNVSSFQLPASPVERGCAFLRITTGYGTKKQVYSTFFQQN
jgi:hypothetical protein